MNKSFSKEPQEEWDELDVDKDAAAKFSKCMEARNENAKKSTFHAWNRVDKQLPQ